MEDNMEFKKFLTPWNWFKKEEEQGHKPSTTLPISREYPLDRLHHEIDQVFGNFFRGLSWPSLFQNGDPWLGGMMLPKVDIAESAKQYTITVEVPGVEEKDIDLTIADGTLTIRGEKHYEKEDKDRQYHRVERSYGHFQRVISLPGDAKEDAIEAKFKNGILTLTIPKTAQPQQAGRKIPIN
jgi:HSP20 family protein